MRAVAVAACFLPPLQMLLAAWAGVERVEKAGLPGEPLEQRILAAVVVAQETLHLLVFLEALGS
jgi:hypothetical protein